VYDAALADQAKQLSDAAEAAEELPSKKLEISLLFVGSDLPEASLRGITLQGLHNLVRKIKELVKDGQFRKVTSTYPFVSLGEVITSYRELTTTDIVER